MKKFLTASLFSLVCYAGAAQAAPFITYTPGSAGVTTPTGTTVYQNFDSYASGSSIGGTNAYAFSSSQGLMATKPAFGSSGNYAAVQAGGTYTTTFFAPVNDFAFVIGSLDSYNTLVLTYTDNTTTTLTGGQIIGGSTTAVTNDGSTTSPTTNGVVNYAIGSGPLLKSATFSASQNAFEFDNLAAAPEPAAWGMMILGFGLVGGVMRRRPSVKLKYA